MGYRTDALKLYRASDVFVFPSFREGLSVSLMEAMASGLPVVCSRIRGNVDLVEDCCGGFHFSPNNETELANNLEKILANEDFRKKMGQSNLIAIQQFGQENVLNDMKEIYK